MIVKKEKVTECCLPKIETGGILLKTPTKLTVCMCKVERGVW